MVTHEAPGDTFWDLVRVLWCLVRRLATGTRRSGGAGPTLGDDPDDQLGGGSPTQSLTFSRRQSSARAILPFCCSPNRHHAHDWVNAEPQRAVFLKDEPLWDGDFEQEIPVKCKVLIVDDAHRQESLVGFCSSFKTQPPIEI